LIGNLLNHIRDGEKESLFKINFYLERRVIGMEFDIRIEGEEARKVSFDYRRTSLGEYKAWKEYLIIEVDGLDKVIYIELDNYRAEDVLKYLREKVRNL
jgi:hypothetical protein